MQPQLIFIPSSININISLDRRQRTSTSNTTIPSSSSSGARKHLLEGLIRLVDLLECGFDVLLVSGVLGGLGSGLGVAAAEGGEAEGFDCESEVWSVFTSLSAFMWCMWCIVGAGTP